MIAPLRRQMWHRFSIGFILLSCLLWMACSATRPMKDLSPENKGRSLPPTPRDREEAVGGSSSKGPPADYLDRSEETAPTLDVNPEAGGEPLPWPFGVGEQLEYTVTWFGIEAGRIAMEVAQETVEGERKHLLKVTLRTSKAFSIFYKIDDRIEITLDWVRLLPQTVIFDRHEGRKEVRQITRFKRDEGVAEVQKNGGGGEYPVPREVREAISAIYYARTLPLERGGGFWFSVFSNKKVYDVELQVLGRESVQTEAGEFKTVVVQPRAWQEGEYRDKGEVYFWLTDDPLHIPVQVKGKVKIGSLLLRLTRFTPGGGAARGRDEVSVVR